MNDENTNPTKEGELLSNRSVFICMSSVCKLRKVQFTKMECS